MHYMYMMRNRSKVITVANWKRSQEDSSVSASANARARVIFKLRKQYDTVDVCTH